MTPQRALIEAAEQAYNALRLSYNVTDYPADGDTYQDRAMASLKAAIASAKAAEEEVETQVKALRVENDRLQTSNAALRRRIEDIANQYAVDCL